MQGCFTWPRIEQAPFLSRKTTRAVSCLFQRPRPSTGSNTRTWSLLGGSGKSMQKQTAKPQPEILRVNLRRMWGKQSCEHPSSGRGTTGLASGSTALFPLRNQMPAKLKRTSCTFRLSEICYVSILEMVGGSGSICDMQRGNMK